MEQFLAGYGCADITPSRLGVPMDGHGNASERLSTGVTSRLYALTLAVTDGEGATALLISADLCGIAQSICDELRQWAWEQRQIPRENVILSAIHQHTCPEATSYADELLTGLKASVDRALADRSPARLYTHQLQTEAMNFLRRGFARDGTFFNPQTPIGPSGFDRYESQADGQLRLIKLAREDAADIILVNFQGHPHMSTANTVTCIGSDWPGVMRGIVEKELGARCIYFSGASGNLNSASRIKAHNISTDYIHHGQRAARYVLEAEGRYREARLGKVRCREELRMYPVDRSMAHLEAAAKVVAEARSQGATYAKAVLKGYPELSSIFQASVIHRKAALGHQKECAISAVTFGDVAFTAHPYEMFDTNGRQLRQGTAGEEGYGPEDQLENPFPMTFITTRANGAHCYIPSVQGFANGGYERDTTLFAGGTGEKLVADYLRLLAKLREEN